MIEFAAVTDPGNRYQHNEDTMGWDVDGGVWLVADGMGGHARGDVAAETVRQSLLQSVLNGLMESPSGPPEPLKELILTAHDAVLTEAVERGFHNMGSTVVMVRVQGREVEIGWCGDSRAYLYRDGELLRLTSDHSLLEQLLRSGVVQPEEAFDHPQKHVLIQALGINEPRPVPDQIRFEMAAGDQLLLCSDGVHDELRDEQIAAVMAAAATPQDCVQALREQVLAGTARDNLSVVCLTNPDLSSNPAVETLADLRRRLAPPRPSVEGRVSQAAAAKTAARPKAVGDILQPATGNSEFDREVARRRANVKAAIAAKGLREPPATEQPALVANKGPHTTTNKTVAPINPDSKQRANAQASSRSDTSEMVTPDLLATQTGSRVAPDGSVARRNDAHGKTESRNEGAGETADTANATAEAAAVPVPSGEQTTFWMRDGTWSLLLLLAVTGLLASYFPWLFS